ncbi:MAG: radical SAM protein [Candidatus Krumholzibacteriia bacterium]
MTAAPLRSLKLTLTEACNLGCPYCYQRRGPRRTMTVATLQAALDLAARLGRGRADLVLSGGEPLLVRDLVQTVLADPRAQGRVRLITNGTLLDAALVGRLAAADASLQISCDGAEAAQEARAPGTWLAVMSTLAAIRAAHPRYWRRRTSVAMIVTPQNVDLLAEGVATLIAADVRRVLVGLVRGREAAWGEVACAALARAMGRVFVTSLRHRRRTGRIPVAYLQPVAGELALGDDACGAGSLRSLAVAADGRVQGCSFLADAARWHPATAAADAAAALEFGRVDDPDLDERWRRAVGTAAPPLFPVARRRAPRGPCAACLLVQRCLVCPLAGPDPAVVPDAHCLFQRLGHRHRRALAAAGDRPPRGRITIELPPHLARLVADARPGSPGTVGESP